MVQSLIAAILCAALALGLFRFAGWFHVRSETALWPRAIASELTCAAPKLRLAADRKLKLLIEDEWHFDFHLQWLAEPKAAYGIPDLHTKALPMGDVEVRVWSLPAFNPASVFILKRTQGHWNAALLGPLAKEIPGNQTEFHSHLGVSWEALWNKLLAEGILTLPEGSCLKDYYAVNDGIGYMVEINLAGVYRLYGYLNPQFQHGLLEPKQMMKLTCLVFPIRCEEDKR